MMKYLSFLIVFLFFFGCSNQQKISDLEQQNAKLETKTKSLQEQSELKDQFIEEYTTTINEVYNNFERIRKREGLITKFSADMEKSKSASLKQKMVSNIESIDSYIKSSKKRLGQLKEKMYSMQLASASLEENIQKLNQTLEEKEKFIEELKGNIDNLNGQVAEIQGELQERNELIDEQTEELHTAYYVIGDEKELKEKGIIEEKGGIFGLRKTKKLAAGFKTAHFTATDVTQTEAIPIERSINDVKIISPQDPGSYQLKIKDEKQTLLEITDPQEFWKMKYLVILTKS